MEIIDDAIMVVKVICPFCNYDQYVELDDFTSIKYQGSFYNGIIIECADCSKSILVIKPEEG